VRLRLSMKMRSALSERPSTRADISPASSPASLGSSITSTGNTSNQKGNTFSNKRRRCCDEGLLEVSCFKACELALEVTADQVFE
jgi:hypothetical protein